MTTETLVTESPQVQTFQIMIEGHSQQTCCQESLLERCANDFRRRLDDDGQLASSEIQGLRPALSAQVHFPDGREKHVECGEYYAPPAAWAQTTVSDSISESTEWSKFVARGLRFPKYNGPSDLCTAAGTCLNPLVGENDLFLIRPVALDEPLVDAGLYIFECEWKDKDDLAKIKAYCEAIGGMPYAKNVVMKFLRFACFEWWYVCNQGIGALTNLPGLKVLSQVVGTLPRDAAGWHPNTRVAVRDTAQLGLNAASQIASSYTGLLTSVIGQVGGTNPGVSNILSITLICTGAPIAIDVYGSVTGGNTAGATCSAGSLTVQRDGAAITASNFNLAPLINSGAIAPTPITLSLTDAPAAGSHTYTVHVSVTASGTGGSDSQANFGQTFMKIREIKR